MSIENESGNALFTRLIKSILVLQQIHGYKLCEDFEEGVRVIGDELLAKAGSTDFIVIETIF